MAQKKQSSRPPRERHGATARRRSETRKRRTPSSGPAGDGKPTGRDSGRAVSYSVEVRAGVLSGFRVEASTNFREPRRACFEAIAGRREPCVNCPVRTLARSPSSKRESAVLHSPSGPFRVVFAETMGDSKYLVHSLPLAEGHIARLQRCRIERLSCEAGLSKREMSVLDLLLLGRSSGEIASALGITERTVRFHVANVLDKLQAESRADLLRLLV